MSLPLVSQVWESGLSLTLKIVAGAFAQFAASDGSRVKPSIKRLAWLVNRSERRVQVVAKELRRLGVLVVVKGHSRRFPTEYRFVADALPTRMPFNTAQLTLPLNTRRKGESLHARNTRRKGKPDVSEFKPDVSEFKPDAAASPDLLIDLSIDQSRDQRTEPPARTAPAPFPPLETYETPDPRRTLKPTAVRGEREWLEAQRARRRYGTTRFR